ncbi:MAG: DNA gyrase C-terminal beta-propeller domain-containing protein, partial [Candidatus Krumholzibacteriia bacterium]
RTARGVRGIKLEKGEEVVGMVVVDSDDSDIFALTENGYGKRTPVADYRVQGRGGKGLITIKCTERNGRLVGVRGVEPGEEVMVITRGGTLIRISVDGISQLGRNTQGVRIINLGADDEVAGLARIPAGDDPDDETSDAPQPAMVDDETDLDVDPDADDEAGADLEPDDDQD